jgi:hypothetical protein
MSIAAMAAVFVLCAGERSASADEFRRTPHAAIKGHNRVHLVNVSVGECMARCTEEKAFACLSFDYYRNQGRCDLSAATAASAGGLSQYEGSPYDHYERMLPGAPAPPPSDKEVRDFYFTKTRNAAIRGHNRKQLSAVSAGDCMRACESESSFVCRSFDYHKGKNRCDLSDKTASEVPLKRDYAGHPYDHYCRTRYVRTRNAAISGHNTRRLKNQSIHSCLAACDNEKSFTCRSVDYDRKKHVCDLSNMRANEVGGLRKDYPGHPYDHYSTLPPSSSRPDSLVPAAEKECYEPHPGSPTPHHGDAGAQCPGSDSPPPPSQSDFRFPTSGTGGVNSTEGLTSPDSTQGGLSEKSRR